MSRTTSPTPPPRSRGHASCAATASTARSSRCSRARTSPTRSPTSRRTAARARARRGAPSATRSRGAMAFVAEHRAPEFLDALADQCAKHGTGPTHLSDDFELVGETFRRFAEDKIRPVAEHVHRTNADVPEEIISGLAELGGFGLSVPEEYDGFATGGESDYIGMVVATEELSRGSLGIGGSLVTRPEILTRALVAGGTEEQKRAWLPRIASGELMVGDHGDRARLRLRRRRREGHGCTRRRRLGRQRREDVGDVRRARRRAHGARPHRPRSIRRAPRPLDVHRREAAAPRVTRSRSTTAAAGKIEGPRHRHHRLPRHALLRGGVRQLVRARRRTSSVARPGSAAASTSRWRASRTAVCRPRPAPSD